MKMQHTSAQACHYDNDAKLYDHFNEKNSQLINNTVKQILKQHNVKKILDVTCGTGSQVFYLIEHGYDVIGSDINANMLQVARNKAQEKNLDITFMQDDMRTVQAGQFDAVVSIFNAVGHLIKTDFEMAMRNAYSNLKPNGLFIFDIFNLDYLLHDNNITKLTIDWPIIKGDIKAREIQYSTIDTNGTLASYTIIHEQDNDQEPTISKTFQTLQVYSAKELTDKLALCGFKVLEQTSVDGSKFDQLTSERILTIAQKK